MTAEFAFVLPAVIVTLMAGVAALGAATQAVCLEDAAGIVARAEARGDPGAGASAAARLSPGARLSVERGDLVCVRLDRRARLGPLPGRVALSASSCAPASGL